jgi:hypothetical protein
MYNDSSIIQKTGHHSTILKVQNITFYIKNSSQLKTLHRKQSLSPLNLSSIFNDTLTDLVIWVY